MRGIHRYIDFGLRNLASRPLSELLSVTAATITDRAKSALGRLERPLAMRRVKVRVSESSFESRLVVFVCHAPRAREAKLAFGLRSVGWKVVLLYAKKPAFDVRPYFDEVTRYRNVWHALSLACDYPSRVFHVFDTIADGLAETFITCKPGRIVLDVYDVWEGFKGTSRERLQRQRACIENADALCCRDLKPKHLARRHGYKLPRKLLFFPDYCWGAESPHTLRPGRGSDEIHVVNAGTFGIEKRGFVDGGLLDVAQTLADQEIHFHIYPHSTVVRHKQHEADYIALARETPFVHLHPSMPMDALITELARYDAGVFLTKFLTFGTDSEMFDRETLLYQGSARAADYLDAGLAVICNKEMRFAFFMAARYGVAIDGSIAVLKQARAHLNAAMSAPNRAKAGKARSAFSVRQHAGRLAAFYENIDSTPQERRREELVRCVAFSA